MIKKDTILSRTILKNLDSIKELRKGIHRNPELGHKEVETTNRLEAFFKDHGLEFNRFEKINGGYIYIDNKKNKTLGIRADIDALPILEDTGVDFESENKGIMHACGHDVHTSIAAGTALTLYELREDLAVNLLIIFQPAEEVNPVGGASLVIDEGIFTKYGVSEFYGLHVWPEYKLGQIGVRPGVIMGSSDKFEIKVKGRSSHAAEPYKGVDAIAIGTEILNGIEHKLAREIDPFDTALVSIGEFKSKGRYNVICDEVDIRGTIRTTNNKTRDFIKNRIIEISQATAKAYKGEVQVNIEDGYGAVYNNRDLYDDFLESNLKIIDRGNLITDLNPSLIGEDFSAYGKVMDSLYFFLGCESEYPLHSNKFMPKEGTIEFGIYVMSNLLLNKE